MHFSNNHPESLHTLERELMELYRRVHSCKNKTKREALVRKTWNKSVELNKERKAHGMEPNKYPMLEKSYKNYVKRHS